MNFGFTEFSEGRITVLQRGTSWQRKMSLSQEGHAEPRGVETQQAHQSSSILPMAGRGHPGSVTSDVEEPSPISPPDGVCVEGPTATSGGLHRGEEGVRWPTP